jgi:hypothetical protein
VGKAIGNLEIPEVKYYRDGYGDQHEESFLCRELDNYSHGYFEESTEPKFALYGKYNIKCEELYKSCKNPYKIIEWLDEEYIRLGEEKKLAYDNYLANCSKSFVPNNTLEQDKRKERCNELFHDMEEIKEIKKYLTLFVE